MSQRSDQISQIIAKRKPLAERIAGVNKQLDSVRNGLLDLQYAIESVESVSDANSETSVVTLLGKIGKAISDVAARKAELTRLHARCSRRTLNIGVVGRARNGKSRLLQSLTGLSSREIPDGSGDHCTGARSVVLHRAGDPFAEVHFHDEDSFLTRIISPYYARLGLGSVPATIRDFANSVIPPLPTDLTERIAGSKYDHLVGYQKHFNAYSKWLQTTSPKRITHEEIRPFVAQDAADGSRTYRNYIAVEHVAIYCKFPNRDVENISVVDMPGLGDTGIGDEERLIKALAEEVDWVLFVRMPRTQGDNVVGDEDLYLYDVAASALSDALPIELWSTMVINRTTNTSKQGDNSQNCKLMIEKLETSRIKVAELSEVDCSDGRAVNDYLLDPALNYLSKNLQALDERYASYCQKRLRDLSGEVEAIVKEAKQVTSSGKVSADEFQVFTKLFRETYDDLVIGLQELLDVRRDGRDHPDDLFREKVKSVIEEASGAALPTREDIERQIKVSNGYDTAYEHFLTLNRTELSRRFLQIDGSLKRAFQEVQADISRVISKEGRIPSSLFGSGNGTFLANIRDYLSENMPQLTSLIEGFDLVAEFRIDYRGMVQHRIRKQLDRLDPKSSQKPQLSQSPDVDEIMGRLEQTYYESLSDIEAALNEMETEPSLAIFAFVEEFFDRVFRAGNTEQEWSMFLYRIRADVWPQQFDQLAENSNLQQRVVSVIRALESDAHPAQLAFI